MTTAAAAESITVAPSTTPPPSTPTQDPVVTGVVNMSPQSTQPSQGVSTPLRDIDIPQAIREAYKARGHEPTGQSYAKGVRRFVEWIQDKGWALSNMPANAVEQYLNTRENPITRNVAASAIRVLFDFCNQNGHTYVAQPVTRVKVTRTRRAQTAAGNQGVGGAPLAPGASPTPGYVAGSPQDSVNAAAAAMQAQAQTALPSAPGGIAQPRQVVLQNRPRTALPGLGGRIRVSKRTDGTEGLAVPIGTRVLVGEYVASDLEGEDSLANFIAKFIRPKYGPYAGQRPCVYIVERLDNVGNPMPGGSFDIPIMPSEEPAPGSPAALTPAQPTPAPVQPRMEDDARFVDYLMQQNAAQNERYEAALAELRAQKEKGGMDATTFMLLAERLKPKEIDVEAAARAFRRANPEPLAATPITTPQPLHLGGFDPFAPPPRDPSVELLTNMVKDLTAQVTTLASRQPPPAPTPAPAPDPLALVTNLVGAMKALAPAPAPTNPLLDKLAEISLMRISQEPKTKTLAETLADLRAVKNFMGGEEGGGITWPEVFAGLFENADKIGAAIAQLRGPPTLPPRTLATQPKAPAAQPVQPGQKPAPPPLPEDAKKAFLTLRDLPPDKDQEIVAALYTLIMSINGAADPWPTVAQRTVQTFVQADSKPEIRSIITQLFVWCGAKKLLTDEVLEKITTVIHFHYSIIYANLTNGQAKTLKDAPQVQAASGEQPTPPSSEPPSGDEPGDDAAEGEADGGEDEDEDEDEAGVVAAPEEPAEKPTEEAARSAPAVVTFPQERR